MKVYVAQKFVTLHDMKPADWENLGGSPPRLYISAYRTDLRKYTIELDQKSNFDFAEFAIEYVSKEKPKDYGSLIYYNDARGVSHSTLKWWTQSIPDSLVIPIDLLYNGNILENIKEAARDDLVNALQESLVELIPSDRYTDSILTAASVGQILSNFVNEQVDLIEGGINGTISAEQLMEESSANAREMQGTLAEEIGIDRMYVDTAMGMLTQLVTYSPEQGITNFDFGRDINWSGNAVLISPSGGSTTTLGSEPVDGVTPTSYYTTTVIGNIGNDIVTTSASGLDKVYGGDGNDFITGCGEIDAGSGNDVVNFWTNTNSTIMGGVGTDTFVAGRLPTSSGSFAVININGGSGTDTLKIQNVASSLFSIVRDESKNMYTIATQGLTLYVSEVESVVFNDQTIQLAELWDEGYYVASKVASLGGAWTEGNFRDVLGKLNLTPEIHYHRYGAFEKGVNPSASFDDDIYMANKAKSVGMTTADLESIFKSYDLDPLLHYTLYGKYEGISPTSLA